MKLFYSPTSPYVRKVRVVVLELGLESKIEEQLTNPWDPETTLPEVNPLGKIPALMVDDGDILFDSPVICEYLDSLHDRDKLFPVAGQLRWQALRMQAAADGIMDAVVLMRLESLRPEAQRSDDWRTRQLKAVRQSLAFIAAETKTLMPPMSIGHIAVACALGYLNFRLAEEDWRQTYPELASWFAEWAMRPSMQATKPPTA